MANIPRRTLGRRYRKRATFKRRTYRKKRMFKKKSKYDGSYLAKVSVTGTMITSAAGNATIVIDWGT